jgi:hypothetical protein
VLVREIVSVVKQMKKQRLICPCVDRWRCSVLKAPMTALAACALIVLVGSGRAAAQSVDLTLFLGRAFPTYDERLTLRPPTPTVPGVDVSVVGSLLVKADGGPVFGGALAFEWGILGVEGRLDATDVGLDLTGARYDLRGSQPPFEGLTARITVSDGRFDADRIMLLSANARIRSPGPVALVVSGGLSYLPDITVTGSVPLRVEFSGIPTPPDFDPKLTLRAVPGQSEHRWGVNGGAGLRVGGSVALMGEVRFFYFREHELRFGAENDVGILDELLARLAPVRFDLVFVNAQAGVTFRF